MNPYKNYTDDELQREIEKKVGKDTWNKRNSLQVLEAVDPELFNEFADRIARGY